MSKSRHTETLIIAGLKVEAGWTADEVVRENGVSKHTVYSLESQVRRLGSERGTAAQTTGRRKRSAEEVGGGPESRSGDAESDDCKKRIELLDRRTALAEEQYPVSERRVCGLPSLAVGSYRYQARQTDEALRNKMTELAQEKPRYGYRRLHVLLQREGQAVNHKRCYRIYREAGLCLRRKKRKHCVRMSAPLRPYTAANQEWALDFAHDVIAAGRAIRVLSVVDAYTRECLALEVDTSFASQWVTRMLEEIIPPSHTTIDSLRQRPGTDEPALPGLVHRTQDRAGPHPIRQAHVFRYMCRKI